MYQAMFHHLETDLAHVQQLESGFTAQLNEIPFSAELI